MSTGARRVAARGARARRPIAVLVAVFIGLGGLGAAAGAALGEIGAGHSTPHLERHHHLPDSPPEGVMRG